MEVRYETVKYITANKYLFSDFGINIDERVIEQQNDRSWGGNMEIAAISKRYDVGVIVWELSKYGELLTPINEPRPRFSSGPQNLCLVRHRGVHYNCVFQKTVNRCPILNRSRLKRVDINKVLKIEKWQHGVVNL